MTHENQTPSTEDNKLGLKPNKIKIPAGRPSGETNVTPKLLNQLNDKPRIVRMTLNVPEDLHAKLKSYTAKNKKTIIRWFLEQIENMPD
jgi:hypothetical protein